MKENSLNKSYILKTIRFEPEMVEKIEQMANESERNFTEQVRFIIKEYLRMKESK